MKIITLLGKGFKTPEDKRAYYSFDENLSKKFTLKKHNYTNMLPLLIDSFEGQYSIAPVFTKEAKETQLQVLFDEFDSNYETLFKEKYFLENTKDFSGILQVLNGLTKEDKYIIDLTHSFRHLPILATISLIANNITDTEKVEHIFFAKEIIASAKDVVGKYEIIDLKEYLELANLSFMLSSFNENYTVSNNVKFSNPFYQQIAKELRAFSYHFLSNSLKPLIEGELISKIIDKLENLQEHKSIENFETYISEIIEHLEDIRQLKYVSEWKKLYTLSKIMDERGYQLNAITLLFEAVGFYCKDGIMTISDDIKNHIKYFEENLIGNKEPKTKYSLYALINQSRNIVKLSNDIPEDKFKGDYLYNPQTIHLSKGQYKRKSKEDKNRLKVDIQKIIIDIETYVKSCDDILYFQEFIRDIEDLRNNLAHGNSSHDILDVKTEYTEILQDFYCYCIEQNIFKVSE
ncbi:MAG TPA: CRISPR-associated DxTHG motif protein [Arcobacter sp.]|nr:CRISPR-associated DxTHG motif protein [Arcobacter sp.]